MVARDAATAAHDLRTLIAPPERELRVGLGEHAETVTITRGALRTILCPGDEACPMWPLAATTLARRHP